MANTLFNVARNQFLQGQINWATDDIRCRLIKTSEYTFTATHTNMVDVAGAARVGDAMALTTSVTAEGAAEADDVTFTAVPSGHQIGAILIYKQTAATDADTTLIAWLDTATGLPITSNGGDIIITWDNGINRIFRL